MVTNKESICEEVKNCLKEEIALEIISQRTIEQSCRPEWKRKTRPKPENEKFSFSHSKLEQIQRKIVLDNRGNPVQDVSENKYSDCSPEADFRKEVNRTGQSDNELSHRLNSTIRELICENKKIRQEKDEIHIRLGEALGLLEKQRESIQYLNVFDAEFPVDYRLLQNHMAQIFRSTVRQEVWFTIKIDANKKKVVSVHIGKKLLPQNIELGHSHE